MKKALKSVIVLLLWRDWLLRMQITAITSPPTPCARTQSEEPREAHLQKPAKRALRSDCSSPTVSEVLADDFHPF